MPKHITPTKEELDANAKQALAEIEAMEAEKQEEVKTITEEEYAKEEEAKKVQPKVEPVKEEVEEETEEPTKEPVKQPETEPVKEPAKDPDYKEKFTNSAREAQILASKNKKINEILEQASQLPEPTEDDLKGQYKDWDVMSEFERTMAKEAFVSKRYREFISEGTKEFKDIDAWNGKVDQFVDDPQVLIDHPELEGKIDDFKLFAMKPTRRGVDFSDLISSFLYEASKETKKNKGAMFETGTAGPSEKFKPKSDKIGLDQARMLRETNYNLWRKMVKEGKIDMTVE